MWGRGDPHPNYFKDWRAIILDLKSVSMIFVQCSMLKVKYQCTEYGIYNCRIQYLLSYVHLSDLLHNYIVFCCCLLVVLLFLFLYKILLYYMCASSLHLITCSFAVKLDKVQNLSSKCFLFALLNALESQTAINLYQISKNCIWTCCWFCLL